MHVVLNQRRQSRMIAPESKQRKLARKSNEKVEELCDEGTSLLRKLELSSSLNVFTEKEFVIIM